MSRTLCLYIHTPNYDGLSEFDRQNIMSSLKQKFEISTVKFSKVVILELKNDISTLMTLKQLDLKTKDNQIEQPISFYDLQTDMYWDERVSVKTNTLDHFVSERLKDTNVVLIMEDVFIFGKKIHFGTLDEDDVKNAISNIPKNHHYRVYNRKPVVYDHVDDFFAFFKSEESFWAKLSMFLQCFVYTILSIHHGITFWFYNYFCDFKFLGLSFVGHRDIGHHALEKNVFFSDTVRISKFDSKEESLKCIYRSSSDNYSPQMESSRVYRNMLTVKNKPKIQTISKSIGLYFGENITTPIGFVFELATVAFFYICFLYLYAIVQGIFFFVFDLWKALYYLGLSQNWENSKYYQNLISLTSLTTMIVCYITLLLFLKSINAQAIGRTFLPDATKSEIQTFKLNRHLLFMIMYCYFGRFAFIFKTFASVYYLIVRFLRFLYSLLKRN